MIIGNKKILSSAFSLKDVLIKDISSECYDKIILTTAYITEDGIDQLEKILKYIFSNEVVIIIGTKDYLVDPISIRRLIALADRFKDENMVFRILLPRIDCFNLNCYYFMPCSSSNFCYIGSGNLSNEGMESTGELLVKIRDSDTLNEIYSYLMHIIDDSLDWRQKIGRYEKHYTIHNMRIMKYKPFVPKWISLKE